MIPVPAVVEKNIKGVMGGKLMQELLANLAKRIEEMRGYL